MLKETKQKVAIISLVSILGVVLVSVLCFVIIPKELSKNSELDMSNADYTYTDTYGDWTYTVSGTNATITKFTGTAADVIIPSTITKDGTTYTVTALYDVNASNRNNCVFFRVRDTLQSIIIPNAITSIGGHAFWACTNLTSVTIGNSVTSIGGHAFSDCHSLSCVTIGNSVISIGEYAFAWCGLTSVEIPNSVTTIYSYAFCNCTKLKSVTIGNSVTSIGESAFRGCTGLTSVEIPNNVTSIQSSAFQYCYKLLEVINKSSLTITAGSKRVSGNTVDDYVGYYAKQIITDESQSKYQVIDNVKYYIDSSNNEYIAVGIENNPTSITINNSCTEINAYAFGYCRGLTSVTIPNSVNSIGDHAFYECRDLESIEIPNSVTSIGQSAFGYCRGLTSVTIGNSVTNIGDYAFERCTGLTSVEIPNSVTTIGYYAFQYCAGLTSVTLGSGVKNIYSSAFSNCNKLLEVINKSSLNIVAGSTDYGNIGYYAKQIIADESQSKYQVIDNIKYYIDSNENLYTVVGSTLANPKSITTINSSCTSIYRYAFASCENLMSVTIPNNITDIGAYAFMDCESLKSITIPNSVTSMGSGVFYSCDGLISITIPNSITNIGSQLFGYCKNLVKVTIPNSVTSIGSRAFEYCECLQNIVIPASVTNISVAAFTNCTNLLNVYFLHNYTNVKGGEYAEPTSSNYIASGAFTNGNENATYYFINQTSRNNAYYISYTKTYSNSSRTETYNRTSFFTTNNFEVMTPQFNVEVNNSNLGSVSGNTNLAIGESTTLTATSSTGCTFKYWLKDGYQFEGSTNNVLSVTFTEYLVTYTAVFEGYFTITTNVSNSEYGTVTSGGTYLNDTEITLTATQNEGYTFVKWLKNNEDFTGNTLNPLTITVISNDTYTAVIKPLYTITTNANNVNYGSVTAGDTYVQDTSITLIATPNYGYKFTKWQKDGQDFANNTTTSIEIIVTADATYTAIFEKDSFTITTEILANSLGSVSSGGDYLYQDVVTLTATPSTGSKFFYWLKNGQTFAGSLSNPLTITVTEDATYTVFFAPEDYNPQIRSPNSVILATEYQGAATTNPEVCGIVKTYGYGSVDSMISVRVEAIATTGYRFVGWKINGESTISAKYTSNKADILLTDIPNSKIIIAVFDKAT